ncbi:MAG: hypothetical protein KME29_14595 [Calothrix sp. FI2-JRJ7]|jgi:ParB family chromosome partitioning protein|nr:hypothetical protein [Calothrix sp. FI2-JRJ7]
MSPAKIGGTPKPGTARTAKPTLEAPASKKKTTPKLTEVTPSNTSPILVAPLDKIVLPKTRQPQPRRYFKPEAMQFLINSVNKNGVLQNIVL